MRSFAIKCGITESLMRNYVNGHSQPGFDKVGKIAEASGVSIDWIATGEGPMYREQIDQAGDSYGERREALGLSEEAKALLDLYFDLKPGMRKKFVSGMRMLLDLDMEVREEKVKKLLDLIEKAG